MRRYRPAGGARRAASGRCGGVASARLRADDGRGAAGRVDTEGPGQRMSEGHGSGRVESGRVSVFELAVATLSAPESRTQVRQPPHQRRY